MPEGERFLPNDSPLAYLVPDDRMAVPLTPVIARELGAGKISNPLQVR